jgi:hypothetical protein
LQMMVLLLARPLRWGISVIMVMVATDWIVASQESAGLNTLRKEISHDLPHSYLSQ